VYTVRDMEKTIPITISTIVTKKIVLSAATKNLKHFI
jgi:hypothetical protein